MAQLGGRPSAKWFLKVLGELWRYNADFTVSQVRPMLSTLENSILNLAGV